MKKILLLSLTVLLMCTLVGCEDFLNQPPYDDFTDAEYWKNVMKKYKKAYYKIKEKLMKEL